MSQRTHHPAAIFSVPEACREQVMDIFDVYVKALERWNAERPKAASHCFVDEHDPRQKYCACIGITEPIKGDIYVFPLHQFQGDPQEMSEQFVSELQRTPGFCIHSDDLTVRIPQGIPKGVFIQGMHGLAEDLIHRCKNLVTAHIVEISSSFFEIKRRIKE